MQRFSSSLYDPANTMFSFAHLFPSHEIMKVLSRRIVKRVFLLRHRETGTHLILHAFFREEDGREFHDKHLFLEELGCPGIPHVEIYLEDETNQEFSVFVCLEEIPGIPLWKYIETLSTPSKYCEIILKCLRKISELHVFGVVHNDINMNNFVVDGEEARLIDFETATFLPFLADRIYANPLLRERNRRFPINGSESYYDYLAFLNLYLLRLNEGSSQRKTWFAIPAVWKEISKIGYPQCREEVHPKIPLLIEELEKLSQELKVLSIEKTFEALNLDEDQKTLE